jgi:hypothetical protein
VKVVTLRLTSLTTDIENRIIFLKVIVHHLNTPTAKVSETGGFNVIHHLCPDISERYFVIITVPNVDIFAPIVCPVDKLHPSGILRLFFLPGILA